MFINQEGNHMTKDYKHALTAGMLVVKMIGLFIVNILVFTIVALGTQKSYRKECIKERRATPTNCEIFETICRNSISSILFWCPDLSRKSFLQHSSGTRFILFERTEGDTNQKINITNKMDTKQSKFQLK